jgi:hypothetical protein
MQGLVGSATAAKQDFVFERICSTGWASLKSSFLTLMHIRDEFASQLIPEIGLKLLEPPSSLARRIL